MSNSFNGFDYANQAWVLDGRYLRCGHRDRPACGCYGSIHEGELYRPHADDETSIFGPVESDSIHGEGPKSIPTVCLR